MCILHVLPASAWLLSAGAVASSHSPDTQALKYYNIWLIEITLFFATKVSVDVLTALPQETAYDNGPRHFKSEIDLIDAQTGAGLGSDPLQSELVVLRSRFGRRNMMKLCRNRRNGGPKGG